MQKRYSYCSVRAGRRLIAMLVFAFFFGGCAKAGAGNTTSTQELPIPLKDVFQNEDIGAFPPARVETGSLSAQSEKAYRRFSDFSRVSYMIRKGQYDRAEAVFKKLGNRSKWPTELALLEVRLLSEQGDKDKVIARCREIIQRTPHSMPAYLQLAEALYQQDKEVEAIEVLRRARQKEPRNLTVLETLGRYQGARMASVTSPEGRQELLNNLQDIYEDIVDIRPGRSTAAYVQLLSFLLRQQGDLEGAKDWARKLVQLDPSDIRNQLMLFDLQRKTGDEEGALETLRKAFSIDPDNPRLLQAINDTVGGSGNRDRLLEFYKSLAEEYPGRDEIQMQYATILMAYSKPDDAVKVLRASLDHHPRNPEGWKLLVRLEAGRDNPDGVQEAIDGYLTHLPIEYDSLLGLTRLLMSVGYWEQALKYQKQLHEIAPDRPEVENLAVTIEIQLGRYNDALKRVLRLIEQDPKEISRYASLVAVLDKLDRLDEAMPVLKKALPELEGDDKLIVLELLVHVADQTKQYDEGFKYIRQALDENPENTQLRLVQIDLMAKAGRMDDAIETAREALDKDPENWRMKLTLADLYRRNHQLDKVEPLLVEVAENNKDDADVLYEIGMIKWDLEEYDDAEALFKTVKNLAPDFADAYNSLGYLYAEQGRNLDEALQLVQRALQLSPGAAHIIDSLGWIYYKQGEYKKAIGALEQAAALLEEDPVVHEHLADAYLGLDRKDEALKRYKQALNLAEEPEKKAEIQEKINKVEKELGESEK